MFFKTGMGRLLVFIIAMLAVTLTSFMLPACSTTAPPHMPATQAQLASVVVLVEQAAEFQEPALSSEAFGEHTGSYAAVWRGRCNAFALERAGALYLVTAAHCTTPRVLGAELRYLPPDGWGIDRAVLVKLDRTRDYAELRPERGGGLVALARGQAPGNGEPVLSVSAFFQEQAPGRSKGELSGSYYGTTQRIEKGWSGSPVLDAHGRVWGLLSKCETQEGKCIAGAVVASLGAP